MTVHDTVNTETMGLRRLAVAINMSLLRLNRLHHHIVLLQQEIKEFLAYYFSVISARFDAMPACVTSTHNTHTSPDVSIPQFVTQTDALDALMHQLYRRLARSFHPDVNPNVTPDTMVAVNHAYHNRELGSLMLLCQQALETGMLSQHIAFSREDMQHYHASICSLQEEMQCAFDALKASDTNRLRTRMLIARLNGTDVIGKVVSAMQQHIRVEAVA